MLDALALWLDSGGGDGFEGADEIQSAHGVGRQGDPGTDLAKGRRRFEQMDGKASLRQRGGCGHAAYAAAGDEDRGFHSPRTPGFIRPCGSSCVLMAPSSAAAAGSSRA